MGVGHRPLVRPSASKFDRFLGVQRGQSTCPGSRSILLPMASVRNSVILSHYNPNRIDYLRQLTSFVLLTLKSNSRITDEFLVVDGSGFDDPQLRGQAEDMNALYLTASKRLSFAEAYNLGLEQASGEYLTTFANDILPPPGWDECLREELERTHAGMALPYLSFADVKTQCRRPGLDNPTFTPWLITLNVNFMRRSAYELVGPLSTEFSGGFNDYDYLIRFQRTGSKVIQADAGNVLHMGKVTVSASTTYDHQADEIAWAKKYSRRELFEHRKRHYPARYVWLRLLASTARPLALKRRLNGFAERVEPSWLRI